AIRYLGRVGTPEAVELLAAQLPDLRAAEALAALGDERGVEGDAASARSGLDLAASVLRFATTPTADGDGGPEATVPAWALDWAEGDPAHPGTRFGGQPTWLEAPTWPLTPAGTPMAFWAQLQPPGAQWMAYVFIAHTDD